MLTSVPGSGGFPANGLTLIAPGLLSSHHDSLSFLETLAYPLSSCRHSEDSSSCRPRWKSIVLSTAVLLTFVPVFTVLTLTHCCCSVPSPRCIRHCAQTGCILLDESARVAPTPHVRTHLAIIPMLVAGGRGKKKTSVARANAI